jgi:salicylate hydroxylase
MVATFHDFPSRVKKLLSLVPEHEVLEWRLRAHQPLPVWVDNNIVLVGDACHPTLPHIAQGAAQAIEDAVSLGIVLSRIKSRDQVHAALMVYQKIRKPRTDWAVSMAAQNSLSLHQDKATREAALAMARLALTDEGGADDEISVDKLSSKELRDKLFKYDIALETEQRFDKLLAEELMNMKP